MAFMGIFLMYFGLFIIVCLSMLISGIFFLIISLVMKKRYNKKLAVVTEGGKKPRKWYLLPRVLAILNLAPLVLLAVMLAVSAVKTKIENSTSLAHNVMSGNYEQAERLLKWGKNPDCTLESNEAAKNGEKTLLLELCSNYGFTDSHDYPVDHEVTAEELAMMELLIEYGADVNAVCYTHEEMYSNHGIEDEYSVYENSDRCGYTPLLYAVYYSEPEIVRMLIEHGADVNVRDYCGYNAVATVADNLDDEEGLEILKILVENGADINATTHYGQSPQWLAYRQTWGQSPLDNDEIIKIIGEYY